MTTKKPIIDLEDEYLVDSSRVVTPHLRLLLAAIGKPIAAGSAWFAVKKQVAGLYHWPSERSNESIELGSILSDRSLELLSA